MKKFLAMLLAVLMLLSSTAAMATETEEDTSAGGTDGSTTTIAFNALANNNNSIAFTPGSSTDNDNSKLEIDSVHISRYTKEDWKATNSSDENAAPTVKTELWMQVDASGQIDVTVPLVLVFSTNVDGGKATAASNYKIYNNNQRNSIAVDKIKVVNEDNSKTMSFWTEKYFNKNIATNPDSRDSYYVVLNPELVDTTAASANQETLNSLAMNTQLHVSKFDLRNAVKDIDAYDETSDPDKALMTIGQGGSINLKPTMETTPLTFITEGYAATEGGYSDNATTGIKLLTVTYTVGLQYNTKTSADIPNYHMINGAQYAPSDSAQEGN